MLQLLMLNPKLAILDETDSGLDVDAVKTVSRGIQTFQQDDQKSLLIITHNSKILEYLHIDYCSYLNQWKNHQNRRCFFNKNHQRTRL